MLWRFPSPVWYHRSNIHSFIILSTDSPTTLIVRRKEIFPLNFAAIDFETANAKRTSACSVGIAVVENGTLLDTYHWLIKPTPYQFHPINISIHGITPEDVLEAPSFFQVWQQVQEIIGSLPLVAHNAAFDMSVLRHGLDLTQSPYPSVEYLCTMLLARRTLPGAANHKLNTLCQHYSIPLQHHDAASDATACASLLLCLSRELGVDSLPQLRSVMDFGALLPAHGGDYRPARLR